MIGSHGADPAAGAVPALRAADFERVRTMIHRHAGIALAPGKHGMVHARLSRRLRALGQQDFAGYLDALERGGPDAAEWQEFVNALTTNLTSFFREAHHFPVLAQHLRQSAASGPVTLWCCAASTGEEPYSMAMTALDTFAGCRPPVSILATDIDTAVLDKARQGIYPLSAVAALDEAQRKRHFLRGRADQAGRVRLRPEVAALVEFRALNLLDAHWPVQGRFNAIFCRNLMIYFDKATQRRLLERLAGRLEPGGLLFAGHSENFTQSRDLFELLGKTVYRLAAARA
ncbi:MAG: CheR family methyltransferase [Rubrivivax sp.]